jgi:hypothetical protein
VKSSLTYLIAVTLGRAPTFIKKFLVSWLSKPNISLYEGSDGNGPERFESVFFELRTRCNSQCSFCAASIQNETRSDNEMSFEVFKKGIDDLQKMGYSGRVAFHITSEPLLSKNLFSFVEHARTKLPRCWFQLLTNGRKLNLANAEKLMNVGINEITVNWYTNEPSKPIPEKFAKIKTEVIAKRYPLENILPGHGPGVDEYKKLFRYNIVKRDISETLSNQASSSPNKKEAIKNQVLGFS